MAVRWYCSLPLSADQVVRLLTERNIDISARTVLNGVPMFGPQLGSVPIWYLTLFILHGRIPPGSYITNEEIVHLDGFGEANAFPHQAFDPGAQREMPALQRLCPPLADDIVVRGQVPTIGSAK
jgi:hypothetical protein